jgi:2-polyprenyl-3-methyl-5-hydroxy-6-metoxy-1,4-benzoquinol methylase
MNNDQKYIKWKSWEEKFGVCSAFDKKYFNAEINKNCALPKYKIIAHEIGFGNGSFLRYARDKGWDISGTEINDLLIEKATEAGYSVSLSENIKHLEDDKYHIIVAFDVIEHIEKNNINDLLIEVRKKLKPGGVFKARFPNGDSFLGMPLQNADITHKTSIGSEMAKYLARSSGYEEVIIDGQAAPVFSGSMRHTIHRVLAWPLKKFLNFLLNAIFFPGNQYEFCSPNLVITAIK